MAPYNALNPALFDEAAAVMTYAKLFPHIMRDFMGKGDCRTVHAPPNLIFSGTNLGGPVTGPVVAVAIQGGSDLINQGKRAAYKAAEKSGNLLDAVTG